MRQLAAILSTSSPAVDVRATSPRLWTWLVGFPCLGIGFMFHGGKDGARFPNTAEELEVELFVLFVHVIPSLPGVLHLLTRPRAVLISA